MGIKILKLVAACSLLIFLSACGGGSGGSSSTPAATVDNSLTLSSINEQATLKNVAKTVSLFATDSSYTQAITFTVTSSSASILAAIVDSTLTLTAGRMRSSHNMHSCSLWSVLEVNLP